MGENTVSIYVMSAILGVWCIESGLNPARWETTATERTWTAIGEGYGLAQWTNVGTSYGRLYQLYSWMTSNGYSMTDGTGQIAYFLEGLDWQPNRYNNYMSFDEFLYSDEQDLYTLVVWFSTGYERGESYEPDYFEMGLGYAEEIYEYLLEHINDSVSWIINTSGGISWADTLNNAVVIAQLIGTGIPPKKKSNKIILMSLRHPRTYPRRR